MSKRSLSGEDEYTLFVTCFFRKEPDPLQNPDVVSKTNALLQYLLQPNAVAQKSYTIDVRGNIRVVFSTATQVLSSKLRSEPALNAFEAAFSMEVVFDLYPMAISESDFLLDGKPRFDLALFDMDSTLIQQEVIDELARSIGLFPAVSAITARAMNGEIEFETSLRERVALLRGVRVSIWDELKSGGRITITPGAKELIQGLRQLGARTAVASGGFTPMANWLNDELGMDYAFANHLDTSGPTSEFPFEHLTGSLSSMHPIITPEEKRSILLRLAKDANVPLHRTMVVGDGSNDLLMMHAAGLGIAWNAKERVQEEAPNRVNGTSLEALRTLLQMP